MNPTASRWDFFCYGWARMDSDNIDKLPPLETWGFQEYVSWLCSCATGTT